MSYERCVGLQISDEKLYQEYRDNMGPILERYQGHFRYDFNIALTLKSENGAPISRVFVLAFPDLDSHEKFFADPDYLKVREQYFKPSVTHVTVIAEFER
jgi:uncharacterized protein (DUF1330 family)